MSRRYLFTSDLHLTEDPRDLYRWEIFKWLEVQAVNRKVDTIFVLGDITDRKDNHSNRLINDIVEAFWQLHVGTEAQIRILRGNHDGSDPEQPLLHFLRRPGPVRFCSNVLREKDYLMVGHQRAQLRFLRKIEKYARGADFLLCHQTLKAVETSSGFQLTGGFSPKKLRDLCAEQEIRTVISGDIHVPQTKGVLTYCGSPYPVHFGDEFDPRVLYWDGGKLISIKRTTIRKLTLRLQSLEDLESCSMDMGDQVKVVYSMPRSEFGSWSAIREILIKEMEARFVTVCGIELREIGTRELTPDDGGKVRKSPRQLFRRFCKATKVDQSLREVGERLLHA